MTTMDDLGEPGRGSGPGLAPPTISDVGIAAGVSTRTVSRVLSGTASVSPQSQRRVEAAIRKLGYLRTRTPSSRRFDGAARIGVVTLHGASRHISEGILGGVVSASESGGHAVSRIDVVVQNNDTAGAIRRAVDSHLAEAVAGLVVVATHAAVRGAVQNAATGIPIVLALANDDRVASVTIDSYNGAVQATRYLLALGHTNLAHVAGPRSLTHAQDRTRGFLDTLAEVGLEPVAVIDGDWTAKSGVVAGVELRETEATAVFCASDQLALGLMHAYSEVGRPAPDGISVVGYDDEDGAAFFSPTLTTIRQDYSAVGKRAYAVLQELIVDGRPRHAELIPELIVRGSTRRYSTGIG